MNICCSSTPVLLRLCAWDHGPAERRSFQAPLFFCWLSSSNSVYFGQSLCSLIFTILPHRPNSTTWCCHFHASLLRCMPKKVQFQICITGNSFIRYGFFTYNNKTRKYSICSSVYIMISSSLLSDPCALLEQTWLGPMLRSPTGAAWAPTNLLISNSKLLTVEP